MNKAFTLVEIIISIFLFSLIMIFLYKSTSSLRLNNKNLSNNYSNNTKFNKILYQLKNDLILSTKIKINNEKNLIQLTTTNTLHQNNKPKVIWTILKQSNTLIRVENKKIDSTNIKIKSIKFYENNNKNKILCFFENWDKKKTTFVVLKQSNKSSITNKK